MPREDRAPIHYRKTRQNTDRIARNTVNVLVCRAFLRSVLTMVHRPLMDRYRPLFQVPTAYRPHSYPGICWSFSFVTMAAVDAVDILWDSPIAR
jgi:hypothetical protein